MTDPTPAMTSFEQALKAGQLQPQLCELDRSLHVFMDEMHGVRRFAYVRLEGTNVTAFVNAVLVEPVEDVPCFQFGCAVPERYRRRGLATSTLKAAIAEMRNGFGRAGVKVFYVEGIVDVGNIASRRVSERVISESPVEVTDGISGLPALQYLIKIETAPPG